MACLVVLEYPSMKILYEDFHAEKLQYFSYIPGFLAFKEIPLYKVLIERVKATRFWP